MRLYISPEWCGQIRWQCFHTGNKTTPCSSGGLPCIVGANSFALRCGGLLNDLSAATGRVRRARRTVFDPRDRSTHDGPRQGGCAGDPAQRIRESGNEKLADEVAYLCGASGGYVPEREEYEDQLSKSKLAKDLHRWFDRQQKSKLKQGVR